MKHHSKGICTFGDGPRLGERLCWLASGLLLFGAIGCWSSWRWCPESSATASVLRSKAEASSAACLRTKSIEAIQPGDRVLACDATTGTTDVKPVVEVYRRTSDHVRIVEIRSAKGDVQALRTTDEHPFWVADVGWTDAGQLKAGQSLCQQDGSLARVVSTRREAHPEGVPVFNFQTEGHHTYFAAQNRTVPAVLVHNACGQTPGGIPRGRWVPESTAGWSPRAKAYQQQITGRPAGTAYEVARVKFDGIPEGTLVEAKGPGYATFVRNGQFQGWVKGSKDMVDQARRQLTAANGAPITWHVAEQAAVTAIQNLFRINNITGINVVFTPPVP